jgi:peptide/nickel transport system permease protein
VSIAHTYRRLAGPQFGPLALPQWQARVVVSVCIVLAVVGCALFPQVLAPDDPLKASLGARLAGPTMVGAGGVAHVLGTDSLGRDLLSRLIYGARVSMVVGLCAVLFAGGIGVPLGLLGGFYRGIVDRCIGYAIDLSLSMPYLVVAIAVVALLGGSLLNLVLILGFSTWVTYARIVRAQVRVLRRADFVEAAYASGAGDLRILTRHVLPNISSTIVIIATQQFGAMMLFEAALSFLGLGVQPPTPTWGSMVADGRIYLETAWWVSTFPGLAIAVSVVSVTCLGNWIRDRLDPYVQIG